MIANFTQLLLFAGCIINGFSSFLKSPDVRKMYRSPTGALALTANVYTAINLYVLTAILNPDTYR